MLVILTSHPIQYQAPMWRALAQDGRVPFEVWFLTDHAVRPTHDREFGKSFAWDRDLLAGYSYRFLPVRAGWQLDRFRGIHVTEPWSKLFKEHGVTRLWVEGWRFSENWAAVFAARGAGVEVWMRGETNDLRPRAGGKEIIRRVLLARLFARVSSFLCIGSANRRFYKSFGIEDSKLLSAPYCVDNQWFAEQAEQLKGQKMQLRREWGIPDDAFCLLFCGKFIPKKRPMDLVHAARQVMNGSSGRAVHLVFVGSGALGDDLRSVCQVVFDAEDCNYQPLVPAKPQSEAGSTPTPLFRQRPKAKPDQLPTASFAGFLNQGEIVKAYVLADCLVLPSDSGETWGLVVNEAIACGIPCIVSDACGCAEDIFNIPHCSRFPLGDVGILASNIQNLLAARIDGQKLKEGISSRFSIQITINSIVSLIC